MELRNKEEVIELVNGISHNFEHNFGECALLHEAVGYKSVIPDKFWEDEEKGGYGLCGLYKAPKAEVRATHEAVITEIIDRINNATPTEYGDDLCSDNYFRYFKALRILGVKATDARITPHPYSPEFMVPYRLWLVLDDSDEAAWDAFDYAMQEYSYAIQHRR